MNPVFFLFSFLLICVNTTSVISLGHQLVATTHGGAGTGAINKKCVDKERRALLDFKALLQDLNGLLSTWTAEEVEADCCEWSGVTCNNQTGHVTKLDLHYCYLVGEISTSLLNLTYLTHLDLFGNYLNGTIPRSIGSLKELQYLDLSDNSFNGSIPRSIGSLTKLRYLDLSINFLNGSIPMSVGSLTELCHLNLSRNSFSGSIPTSINGSLIKLRHLDLSHNSFNGSIPTSIGSLTELTYMDLGGNDFGGSIPSEFGNLTSLQNLSLQSLGNCTIQTANWLSHLSHLQYLDLDGVSLAKANYWVDVILSLRKLSYLSLMGCDLSQVMHPYSSSSVNSSTSIATLYLRSNNLNSSIYHWLFPLTSDKIVSLDLSDNMLDEIPKYFGNLCSLAFLYFVNNDAVVKLPDFLNNLSGCTSVTLQYLYAPGSRFTGSLSNAIQNFSSLKALDLSHNQLNGTISEKMWELPMLEEVDVSSNFLKGPAISKNIGESKLIYINLSNNTLEGVPSKAHMSNLCNVEYIDLSSCILGPRFPKWIQTLKNLTHLDISETGILDTIPVQFWNTWPSKLTYLNLSSNNISGILPDLRSNFDYRYSIIDLSSNNFSCPVLNVPSSLVTLDLSRNKFYGGILFLCQIVGGLLTSLDLSHNSFTGQIPDCLRNFKELVVLNLGNNNLSGRLPTSVGSLTKLEVLYLYNNDLFGEFPLSLRNCTKLTVLDLGANRFFGNVPVWIGENFSGLYALILRSNNFFGPIPLQLCQLVHLQILDLSMNNLSGTIPSCVNNLTSMGHEGFLPLPNVHSSPFAWYSSRFDHETFTESLDYVDRAVIQWQGIIREFSSNLRLLKNIDLSSNNLTGKIPYELTNLHGLLGLNLSKNALLGEIPRDIGDMKELLTLDLSRNDISGEIPQSLSQLTLLNYLDVSYNNLSGRIPSSTQLQSFEPSRYTGYSGLCGPPVTKNCPGDEELQVPPTVAESKDGGKGMGELQRLFYIGGAIGFATGFWIACGAVLLYHRGRPAYFHCLRIMKD